MPNANVAAVVLAAGKGTRMKSASPKVLHLACGKALLAWPLDAVIAAGAEPVVVVTGHGQQLVEGLLTQRYRGAVRTAHQSEQKGTGHAAQVALGALEGFIGTVLVVYGDCPLLTAASLVALVELQQRSGAPVALWTTHLQDATGYGRIVRGDDGLLAKIVEHKDADELQRALDEVNPGVYAVDAAFLRLALAKLESNNAQGELYLTDIVAIARANGFVVPTLAVSFAETLGVNDRVQLAEAARVLRGRIVQRAMLAGVSFDDPTSAYVDDSVRFGIDVVIAPNVVLSGKTALDDGVRIGTGAVLVDTMVSAGAVVHPYSVCDGATIGERAIVGPFARLRPAAVLEEGAHVGNFVELKKTRLGKGAKANHLAYLGDADIGAGTNIGAGTITCNYDGIGKYVTAIGERVFIGSNCTLVAPLVIEQDAYVAAGSVVTERVPADALALGRAKQTNKEGYAKKVRDKSAARAPKKQ